jgi:hypothetical protein
MAVVSALSRRSTWLAAVSALFALAACGEPEAGAPTDRGVCWTMSETAQGEPSYTPISRGVANLESCAAGLEARRMIEGRPITGAYQGHFIFVTEAQITSARSLSGSRFRVFEAADRLKIQQSIRQLMEAEANPPGGAAVPPPP